MATSEDRGPRPRRPRSRRGTRRSSRETSLPVGTILSMCGEARRGLFRRRARGRRRQRRRSAQAERQHAAAVLRERPLVRHLPDDERKRRRPSRRRPRRIAVRRPRTSSGAAMTPVWAGKDQSSRALVGRVRVEVPRRVALEDEAARGRQHAAVPGARLLDAPHLLLRHRIPGLQVPATDAEAPAP